MEKIKIRNPLLLGDGIHTGVITQLEERNDPYKYLDLWITEDSMKLELKYGVPVHGSTNSKLVILLSKFTKVNVDDEINPEEILLNKKVQFLTMTEEGNKGKFLRIVDNSVKPI